MPEPARTAHAVTHLTIIVAMDTLPASHPGVTGGLVGLAVVGRVVIVHQVTVRFCCKRAAVVASWLERAVHVVHPQCFVVFVPEHLADFDELQQLAPASSQVAAAGCAVASADLLGSDPDSLEH